MHLSEEELLEIYNRSLSRRELSTLNGYFQNQVICKTPKDNLVPNWPLTLNECLKASPKPETLAEVQRNRQVFEGKSPLPFQEILLPFIDYGRKTLKAEVKEDYNLLDEPAHIDLEHSLLNWLSYINSLPMELAFSTFRASCQTSLSRLVKPKNEQSSRVYYNKFIPYLFDGPLCDYLKEYAVLARLITSGVELWIETVAELIGRFKKDKSGLEKYFNQGKELGKIIEVKVSLFDRRDKGRCVMVLTFEPGLKLVYKPRDLGIEQGYNELIDWLNSIGAPVDFKSFKVLNFDEYGWAGFVSNKPIGNKIEAQAFYKRAGALLCLAHILGATDLHHGNMIGHGEYPVLIDLETLLHPIFPEHFGSPDIENANERKLLINSVLRTGLLPYWQLHEKGQAYDMSALGASKEQDYYIDGIRWENINTDHMQVHKKRLHISSKEKAFNTPQKYSFTVHEFIDEAVQGFSEMYTSFMNRGEYILRSSYWNALSNKTVRYIFRPTGVYSQLQQNLLLPEFLRNGMDRSKQLDILCQGMAAGEALPTWWPLIEAEQNALEIMDIPHFSICTGSGSIDLPGGHKIKDYFTEPSFDTASFRLKQLNGQDLNRQVEIMRESILYKGISKNCHSGRSEESVLRSI